MSKVQNSKDVASMLLNSTDSRVAAAARRVFSNAIAVQNNPQEVESGLPPPIMDASITRNKNSEHIFSADIRDAASAMAMLAPEVASEVVDEDVERATTRPPEVEILPKSSSERGDNYSVQSISPSPNPGPDTATLLLAPDSTAVLERKKLTSPIERLQRSRERNKMHARKTRQRKKEQMKTLEAQVEELKTRQVDLKRSIEEKNTASILVELFNKCEDDAAITVDPRVETLLKRPTDEIPDSSKVPELPALILPGQHSTRRGMTNVVTEYPDDGIDYKLLAKDRSTCSQEELDRIRRERNRMHAKRTRDRKRIFVEEMEKIINQLKDENTMLEKHLLSISDSATPTLGRSPALSASTPIGTPVPNIEMLGKACEHEIVELLSRRGAKRKRALSSSSPTPSTCDASTTSTANSHQCEITFSSQSMASSFPDEHAVKSSFTT